ncbi:MAG: hypothetical protein GY940_30540 [bacterium]|nr:hypothetical protein [bacterium]
MATNVSNKIKVALIASLILNLAFITGFVVKKISASNPEKTCEPPECGQTCIIDQHQVGYRYFCKKPGFKETFEEYRQWYLETSRKLSQIKTDYLRELKKENSDRAAIGILIRDMNRTAGELNEKNYRHLLGLKGMLSPREFSSLIDCMNHTLNAHRSPSFPLQALPCEESKVE